MPLFLIHWRHLNAADSNMQESKTAFDMYFQCQTDRINPSKNASSVVLLPKNACFVFYGTNILTMKHQFLSFIETPLFFVPFLVLFRFLFLIFFVLCFLFFAWRLFVFVFFALSRFAFTPVLFVFFAFAFAKGPIHSMLRFRRRYFVQQPIESRYRANTQIYESKK